ncbi:MAG: serine hydrolase [Acidobacteria bacterium]|nr:serine hydrolase [Acidobacteriota bacterium]
MKTDTSSVWKFVFLIVVLLSTQIFAQAQPSSPRYKYAPPRSLNDGIRTGTLKSARLDEARMSAGMNEILKETYGNIHSVLVIRSGKLVFEEYFTGPDQNNHQGEIGVVVHNGETLHDIRSVTKSVVALAVLIAHSQGKIKDLDQPIFDFFPEYASYAEGEKKNITIRHALTMTPGLEWNEGFAYSNPANTAFQMNNAPNTIEFVLSRKLVNKPGATFEYNGGTTQLLAAILKKATGSDIENFTAKHLLTPLGITKYEWASLQGQPDADSGLRLRSRDMAKIGSLVMNYGKWKGKQIIPAKLIDDATRPSIKVSEEADGWKTHYGYQIWLQSFTDAGKEYSVIELTGNGGQKIMIDKKNDLIVVVTAGTYDSKGLKKYSFDILLDIAYPSVTDR